MQGGSSIIGKAKLCISHTTPWQELHSRVRPPRLEADARRHTKEAARLEQTSLTQPRHTARRQTQSKHIGAEKYREPELRRLVPFPQSAVGSVRGSDRQ
jgi:hypothetical protein